MSRLKDDNWAYKEGRIAYNDPPNKKSYYFYCESSLFHFKKRGYKVIGNNKKGIEENIDANKMAHHLTLGTPSNRYNGDTYLIDSILKTKANKKPKWLSLFKKG